MKPRSIALILGVLIMASGCNSNKVATYGDMKPTMSVENYFNGPIKAWGIVQNRSGEVTSRFDVAMHGSWENGVGTLKEDFVYYEGANGKTEHRVWTITQIAPGQYEGKAGDIIGKATGNQQGNAMNWAYQMDLPVDDTTYRITFDDWMWLMNDGVLINRSYLKKFGFTVAELTIFMQKQPVK